MTTQALSFATGRELSPNDSDVVQEIGAAFEDSGYQMRELLVAVVTSASFRYLSHDPTQRLTGEQ